MTPKYLQPTVQSCGREWVAGKRCRVTARNRP